MVFTRFNTHRIMCDFQYQGESAASFHNRFPEEWGALTKAALTEAAQRHRTAQVERLATGTAEDTTATQTTAHAVIGVGAIDPADVMFFMRSAWIQSPRYAPVFWLGDQLVSWDSNDGLRSALTGALSSGLVGHAITHSDIGGYTVETDLGENMYYVRTPELLQRWSEMGAFGFGELSFCCCSHLFHKHCFMYARHHGSDVYAGLTQV
jgi:hypothetical protein